MRPTQLGGESRIYGQRPGAATAWRLTSRQTQGVDERCCWEATDRGFSGAASLHTPGPRILLSTPSSRQVPPQPLKTRRLRKSRLPHPPRFYPDCSGNPLPLPPPTHPHTHTHNTHTHTHKRRKSAQKRARATMTWGRRRRHRFGASPQNARHPARPPATAAGALQRGPAAGCHASARVGSCGLGGPRRRASLVDRRAGRRMGQRMVNGCGK